MIEYAPYIGIATFCFICLYQLRVMTRYEKKILSLNRQLAKEKEKARLLKKLEG